MSDSGLKIPTTSEADVRALALAKIKAQKAYNALWLADTTGFTDEQLIDHEFAVADALTTLTKAIAAFNEER